MTEDEMIRLHHQLDGHEFEQAPRVGDGQGGLACCRPWGHKEVDTTEWLNWTELNNDIKEYNVNYNIKNLITSELKSYVEVTTLRIVSILFYFISCYEIKQSHNPWES